MIPNTFSDYFKSLPEDGRQAIIDELTQILLNENKEATLQSFSEKKESVSCPSCSSNKISGNGKQKGVQRYVCRSCKKYFRDTTGLLTHNMKKSALVSKYMYNLLMGYSIRKCAKETGICIQTSFDWRHKIIGSLNAQRPSSFEGIVESDDIFFLESSKGSRSLERERRSRGSKAKKRGRISKKDLDRTLGAKLEKGSILCTDAHRSYTAFERDKDIEHHKFVTSKGQRVVNMIYHVQNVNNTAMRLRTWMRPYNGVATKYLQNYMNWFMMLEKIKHNSNKLKVFATCAMANSAAYDYCLSTPHSVVI